MDFHALADNLRQSFRALAGGKPRGSVVELPGISIASLGVTFQMFNAAFPSMPIATTSELEQRVGSAASYFKSLNLRWALWVCEDWIAPGVRRRLSQTCAEFGLRLSSEMPGLSARSLRPPGRAIPILDVRLVDSLETLDDFRGLGSNCFHVPISWFSEVFDTGVADRRDFVCWVGYADGCPVATAATVSSENAIGVYNVATTPEFRRMGYAEAITRCAIMSALGSRGTDNVVLQSTSQGLRLYEHMGFEMVTRVLVYSSIP